MNAIFGKLSILCFIAVVVGTVIYGLFNSDDGMGIVLMMCYLPMLFVPLGFLLCVISVLKKETPKRYRYIGFSLNCLSLLMLLVLAFGHMFF